MMKLKPDVNAVALYEFADAGDNLCKNKELNQFHDYSTL